MTGVQTCALPIYRAIADFGQPVEVVLRAFELDPGAPAVPTESTVEHLQRKYGVSAEQVEGMLDDVRERGATVGLDFRFDLARGGNTFDAHRLLHLAAAHGRQADLAERLFTAAFVDGVAVGDLSELERIGVESGLPDHEVRDVLAGDRYADAVRQDEQQAREYQIGGVPFFVIDGRLGVGGAQPAAALVSALQQAASS